MDTEIIEVMCFLTCPYKKLPIASKPIKQLHGIALLFELVHTSSLLSTNYTLINGWPQ